MGSCIDMVASESAVYIRVNCPQRKDYPGLDEIWNVLDKVSAYKRDVYVLLVSDAGYGDVISSLSDQFARRMRDEGLRMFYRGVGSGVITVELMQLPLAPADTQWPAGWLPELPDTSRAASPQGDTA